MFSAKAVSAVVFNSPMVIVALVGIVLAIARWRRHPSVSVLVLLAFGCLLTSLLVKVVLDFGRDALLDDFPDQLVWILSVAGISRIVLDISAWILLTVAVFTGRGGAVR